MSQQTYFTDRIKSTFSPMDYMQAKQLNPNQFILIDVRNGTSELKKEKIKDAVEIPQAELENRLAELPKNKELILYCWDVWCNTAAKAAVVLLDNGYTVRELSGGIAAWKTMNFPLVSIHENNPSCGC